MNPRRFADEISESVVAYCEAIQVPGFDEAAITSRRQPARVRQSALSHTRLWTAASLAAMVALLAVLWNIRAVVAGAERVFVAFTVAAGRTTPMTVRVVDFERARADMPFAIIAPPSIVGAPIVAIDEIYADASPANASVIFEIHGTAPGPEIMIIESKAARFHPPTLFAIGGPAETTALPRVNSPESLVPRDRHASKLLLRESFEGRTLTPASWIVHGTRVVVMSPPGLLSSAQLEAIRRAMSQ